MFSYFVQGESVYAVALHICSLWHDFGGKERMGQRASNADSCKLTAAGAKENCAAAQEKQLTMLQVAVAAATAAAPAPTADLVASSCHCSWLWFSDCIAQDFNATVFARQVKREG